MSEEQQAAPGDEEKIIYIKIPPPGTGNLRTETALARLQTYIGDFRADQRAVKQAAQTFREALQVQPAECTAVIRVLQAVRQKTASCLEFLEGESAFWAHHPAAIDHLDYLDGEETARLILRLDAFRSKYLETGRDEERINTHVRLQSDLASCVKHLRDLITELEQLPGEDPSIRAAMQNSSLTIPLICWETDLPGHEQEGRNAWEPAHSGSSYNN